MDLFAKQAEDKGIEFINFFHCDVPEDLRGDPGRVRQILSNLVSNALKFTEIGEVVVRVRLLEQTSTHANVHFSVEDTGIGIPPEKVEKLFTAFTQADASTTRKFGGTGLGLAICKKFTELMGGKIGVFSDPDKGSTFWFTLELPKQHEGFQKTASIRTNLHGLRTLIVDRNPTNRAVLDHYLSSLGIRCRCVANGPMAGDLLSLAAKKSEPFDLAILDSTLLGINGSELARLIRQSRKIDSLKVVFLTPVGKRETANLAKQTGIDAYLTKPIHFSSLVECLGLLKGDAPKVGSSRSLVISDMLAQPKVRRRLRILVADDNHISQMVTVSLLKKLGHRANVAGNGKEAVEAFKLVPYDAVLMDLQMPEMDGFEASTQIRSIAREQNRHTSIIAVTAHARNEDREKCLASGMDDYITKPIKPEELKTVIARRLSRAKASPLPDSAPTLPSGVDVFNLSEALAQVGGDRELLREITRLFLEQLPELLQEAHQALSRSDYRSLGKLAHTLTSSAGQLAAQKTLTAAKKLEELGNQEDSSHVPEALAELEREIALLKSTISDSAYFSRCSRAARSSPC
jgi:CheY-like chemotaxis protein